MALKRIVVAALLVSVLAASQSEAQLPLLGPLLSMFNISSTIFCSTNGNMIANATTRIPPFADALVQLKCGGDVISSSRTNADGGFSMLLSPLQMLLSSLLSSCSVVVATPLSTCNASLPSIGFLVSQLQYTGYTNAGLLSMLNVAPKAFQLMNV